MVSLPYHSSTLDYLAKGKVFDVRRTPSAMGLVSEYFRRRKNVCRSLRPTHPVLACGPQAEWLTTGHEDCLYPCGPGTPFDKLLTLNGSVVFLNLPFAFFAFFHNLEHRVAPGLDFPVYHDQIFEVPVVDCTGLRRSVKTHVFSREAIRRRRFDVFEGWLWRAGLIRKFRVGASNLLMTHLTEVVEVVDSRARSGEFFYRLRTESADGVRLASSAR